MNFLEQIGETAGNIWRVLETKGPQSLSALKKQVKAPGDMVLMAVGWLAREEKLALDQKGRTQLLRLK
ncbi:MAG TPA: winged helix-turn-helix domain-containing protein [Candidatus Acidoferrales bacterium]|nr:winged helix-turn-helix domain-containing protein [Candidatus Acidoferrales bacterium]